MADNPHIGHRQRMRRKLFEYSRRVFDTYELLEMLLYFSIRVTDTNPVSKALLRKFSSLNGVLHAEYSELISVEGVGEKSAKLIVGVNRLHKALFYKGVSEASIGDDSVILCLRDLASLIGIKDFAISKLTERFTPKQIFEADGDTLAKLVGESAACLILLVSALASRRITDRYKKQKRLSDKDTENYLIGLFFGLPCENVYMLSFSDKRELICADFISEGILNGSEILPLKLIETAKKRDAHSVIIAHNHPMASAKPSQDDIAATRLVSAMLSENGITLFAHYTVSQNQVIKV